MRPFTAAACIQDLRAGARVLLGLPPEYFVNRLLQLAVFVEEHGLEEAKRLGEAVGAALLEPPRAWRLAKGYAAAFSSSCSMRVPSTFRNSASQAGWAGHAGAVTRVPSTQAPSILVSTQVPPALTTSGFTAG